MYKTRITLYPEKQGQRSRFGGILTMPAGIVENGGHGPIFEVTVCCTFRASHQLTTAAGCEELHEHDWCVRATYTGSKLRPDGMLVDFETIRAALEQIVEPWRGQNLNRLAAFETLPPSAENVAVRLAERLQKDAAVAHALYCVEVEEAPGCAARYYPAGR